MKRFVTLWSILLLLSLVLVPFAGAQDEAMVTHLDEYLQALPSNYGLIRPGDLNTELVDNPPFLVDVRQPEEYAEGFIEGAVNIPLRELAQNLDKLPAMDAPIVTYCKAGHRGVLAMTALQVLGYENVRNLYGGIDGWIAEEFPTVTEAAEAETGAAPDIDADVFAMVDDMLTNIPEGWGVIRADALNTMLAEPAPPFLLDVRTKREVADGYIEGMDKAIEIHTLAANVNQLPEDKSEPIVVYCGSGWRSAIAEAALWMLGYEDVLSLAGGRRGWEDAGYPMPQDMERVADYYTAKVMPTGDAAWSNITVEALAEALEGDEAPFVLDVRQPEELEEAGYIPGAVHVPLRELGESLELLPAMDAPIVTYCKAGTRGTFATTALQMLGYEDVRNLKGGFGAWAEAGNDVATGEIAEPEAGEMPEGIDSFVLEHVSTALATWPEGWGMVKPDALSEMMADEATKPTLLIDVRKPEEWVTDGIIEGATLVPLTDLGAYTMNMAEMLEDKTVPIVVYCKAGHRGAIGMTVLRAVGYENVLNLAGGFDGWVAAGLPSAEAPAE